MRTFILIGLSASVFLLVFCLGLSANIEERLYLARRPGLVVRSLLSMSVLMPLVAAGLALAFDLPPAVKIALVALAVSPVPPILPRKQLNAGGSADYALGLLVTAALFSIIFVPVAVDVLGEAFGKSVRVPPGAIAAVVFKTVLIPLGVGMAVRLAAPQFAQRVEKPLSKLATLLLLAAIVPVLFVAWPAILSLIGSGAIAAFVLIAIAGIVTGHLLGGPENSNRTVLALSTASRHPGVAVAIANLGFPQEKSAIAAILLNFLLATAASSVYLAWRRRATPGISRRAA